MCKIHIHGNGYESTWYKSQEFIIHGPKVKIEIMWLR
jgi:hypothetical protein